MDINFGHKEINIISLNWKTSYDGGTLILPVEFNEKFGGLLPGKLNLKVPSGAVWVGKYDKFSGRIGGVENMILFYGMTKYNLTMLQYVGGADFNVYIFNCYGVEIDYRFGNIVTENGREMSELDNDKIGMAFTFNAYNQYTKMYKMKIEKTVKILTKAASTELNIDQTLGSIEIGFLKKKWVVEFKCDNDVLYVGQGWNNFVKEAELSEGDICIIQTTGVVNSFEVAVFNMNYVSKWLSYDGEPLSMCKTRIFKLLDKLSIERCEIHLPKLFMDKYGQKLNNHVTLWMGDSNVWIAAFCNMRHSVYGLHRMIKHYSLVANCYVILHYPGYSTFYMTIFSNDGMDILRGMREMVLLKDVIVANTDGNTFRNEDCGTDYSSDEVEYDSREDYDLEETTDSQNIREEVLNPIVRHETSINSSTVFFVTLKASHFDVKSHGVYCPANLPVSRGRIRTGMKVVLVHEAKEWEMKANPVGKRFRIGAGWCDFMKDNCFCIGERLRFEYRNAPEIVFLVSRA